MVQVAQISIRRQCYAAEIKCVPHFFEQTSRLPKADEEWLLQIYPKEIKNWEHIKHIFFFKQKLHQKFPKQFRKSAKTNLQQTNPKP